MTDAIKDRYKVKLTSISNSKDMVVFNVSPELTESRNVNYKSLELTHLPGSIYAYGSSGARTFSLVVKLVSRTLTEATENARKLRILRSWTMPYFGTSGIDNLLGSPPDVLYLDAYSEGGENYQSQLDYGVTNLYHIPTIITQLTNSYPSDVTYIPIATGEPFPVIMNLDILLTESHSPLEYSKFSLEDYKVGKMLNF